MQAFMPQERFVTGEFLNLLVATSNFKSMGSGAKS
jgi:hypothetical protein